MASFFSKFKSHNNMVPSKIRNYVKITIQNSKSCTNVQLSKIMTQLETPFWALQDQIILACIFSYTGLIFSFSCEI